MYVCVCVCTCVYNSAFKWNEILTHDLYLDDDMLSKLSQSQKEKCLVILLI